MSVRLQTSLPRYLMNGLNNFDKTYREYWPALVAEWLTHLAAMCNRAWRTQWPGFNSAWACPPTKELSLIIPVHMMNRSPPSRLFITVILRTYDECVVKEADVVIRQEQWRRAAAAGMVQFGQQEERFDSSSDAAQHPVCNCVDYLVSPNCFVSTKHILSQKFCFLVVKWCSDVQVKSSKFWCDVAGQCSDMLL